MSDGLETNSLLVGVGVGFVCAYVVIPGAVWAYLRLSEPGRRRAFNKAAAFSDATLHQQVTNLGGTLGQAVRSVGIPAVEVATGQPWRAVVHKEASVVLANKILELLSLPTVAE